jgi:tetraacyldisaccharide 4'-kinase
MRRPWLAPLAPLYAVGSAVRDLRIRRGWEPVRRLGWPVISVGNLSTGGAGKTPLAIALARLLTAKGWQVDVLSRGYGRINRQPALVRVDGTAAEFGDEPLLIARETGVPVYVARQRYDAGLLAEAAGRQDDGHGPLLAAHILDDGFQHRQLARDVDILLLNRDDWQDVLLPAGNLREPMRAMRRAQVIALPADDPDIEKEVRQSGWQGALWRLRRRMDVSKVGGPVAAFCGIARPGQFFAGLESAGVEIATKIAFRDHHPYTAADVERLSTTAQGAGASAFITTEKDLVRLGDLAGALPKKIALKTAKLAIEIEDETSAVDWLVKRLIRQPSHHAL